MFAAPPWSNGPDRRPGTLSVVANLEELQRALDSPWEKWTVFLPPEQRQRVDLVRILHSRDRVG